jgi:hypothetical protein
MNTPLGTTNSPQDVFLNARRKRRVAQVAAMTEALKDQPLELAFKIAQLEEEDAADIYNFTMQNAQVRR